MLLLFTCLCYCLLVCLFVCLFVYLFTFTDPNEDPSKRGLRLLYTANSEFYDYKEPQIPKPSIVQTYPPTIPIDSLYTGNKYPVGMQIPYFMSDGKTLRNINVASGRVKEGLEEDAYQVSL